MPTHRYRRPGWVRMTIAMSFIVVSAALVLIILVQRPQGGGLAGAFGGAGGGGADTAFGGRTGDALTVATVAGFVDQKDADWLRGPGRNASVRFFDYDWSLNDAVRKRR